ncbi:MAG TPA: DUF5696 domain-containing protein [Pirellulales bacterium]|nr:DUF5696 domain-containing protein [Pirellulales bacterium]
MLQLAAGLFGHLSVVLCLSMSAWADDAQPPLAGVDNTAQAPAANSAGAAAKAPTQEEMFQSQDQHVKPKMEVDASGLTPQQISAKKFPRSEWGAPEVAVAHEADNWILKGKKRTVTLNAKNLAMEISAGANVWKMLPSRAADLLIKVQGVADALHLADAENIDIVPYDTGFKTGVKIILSNWKGTHGPVDLKLYCTVALEGADEELVCEVAADEQQAKIWQLDWPGALDGSEVDFTVLSNGRGALLPRNWPKPYFPIRATNPDGTIKPSDTSEVQSNVIESWSMSWWGFQKGPAAMMVIVQTPDDAAYQFEHPAGGPTVIGPRWRECLGQLTYPRSCRFCFFEKGNYVDLAKRYRRYVMDTGQFVSLKEKIARQPIVKELIGTPQARVDILTNIKSDSLRYKKDDPSFNHHVNSFDDRAQELRGWKAEGIDHLLVVLTGWPREGYDRQHPDELPPAPEAGGWEGMKRLAETCHELGYLLSLHDQYRDYYTDAPSYDPQFAVHEADDSLPAKGFPGSRFGTWKEGPLPFMNNWDGGTQTYLNNRFMPGHLIKTYQWLIGHGIHPQGVYLDVFGYVPPDEDFNPQHPCTRTEAMRARALCFNWSRNHLGFVGTEAGCDWTIPYVDCVSSMSVPTGRYISVPLFNLVYHDAVMTPYAVVQATRSNQRPAASGEPHKLELRGFLNGGMPQLGPIESLTPDELAAARRLSALHQRVALLEMVNHEFLDDKFRKERTTFADGTTVTVDWDANTVKIMPDLDESKAP